MRLREARNRIAQLTEGDLVGLPPAFQSYMRLLDRGLHDHVRFDLEALADLNSNPVLSVALITGNQSLTPGAAMATVVFNSSIMDSHGWYANGIYTPQEAGFYRCSWALRVVDSGAIAAGTAAFSQLLAGSAIYGVRADGNGTATAVQNNGSVIVECDGSTTALAVQAQITAGSAPYLWAGSAGTYPCWMSIDYIGRRKVPG